MGGSGAFPHWEKTKNLIEESRKINQKMIEKLKSKLRARLFLCSSSAGALIGREDGKICMEDKTLRPDFCQRVLRKIKNFKSISEKDKALHKWLPIPLSSYEITEDEAKLARGIKLIKSALLIHTKHCKNISPR